MRRREATLPDRVYDQITRPVRDDDKIAFAKMDAKTLYSDLPDELKRYRDDIFDDKYKRLDENDLSRLSPLTSPRTVTGTSTPRDAVPSPSARRLRLQTFPDRYRFAGPPSAAFRQIGNAVPPILGEHLARAVRASFG